ncbi:MAG: class I SAM-dependent methyltransferase [Methylomicrobium sp.]
MKRFKNQGASRISRKKNIPSINATIQHSLEETNGSQTRKEVITEEQKLAYDENLLERARTQWQFGDWESLAQLQREIIEAHPERAQLALFAAAGYLQTNNISEARQMIFLAREWGGCNKLISQILVAGVHNTLGRAFAINGLQSHALNHFENAIAIGLPNGDRHLLTQARINQQYLALGLLPPRITHPNHEALIDPEDVIDQALNLLPQNPALLIASAEAAMRRGQYDEAIRRWQQLASIEGVNMPMVYYDRLQLAYDQQKSFPLGAPEEEVLSGDGDKYEQLRKIHELLKPKSYLEIGVQTGKSLALASCLAIGVDPMPQIKVKLGSNVKVVRATSDEFFAKYASELIPKSLDMVFIDGMHLFEYVLRDFINVERYSSPYTLVVIDDIYPGHPAQADRNRRTRAWTGDVWKLFDVLKEYRPDLLLQSLDASPTGLLMITGLDSTNHALSERYDEIVTHYAKVNIIPEAYILRTGSWSCNDLRIEQLISGITEPYRNNNNKVLPTLQVSQQPNHHVIISGTGRAGTTLLVQLLTTLGFDTGFQDGGGEVFENCNAGLEIPLTKLHAPFIVKDPRLCDYLEDSILNHNKVIEHAIIPVRKLYDAAQSRRDVQNRTKETLNSNNNPPGGLWDTLSGEDQEGVLAKKFFKLVYILTKYKIPVTFLEFPRFAVDPDYLYDALAPIFHINREKFNAAFIKVVEPNAIHQFSDD